MTDRSIKKVMSPRSQEQLAEIRELSRQKILEAGLDLFGSQGFHNTSISQVAKAAGVAKGLIYNYFESKEALLEAIFHAGMAESQQYFEQAEALSTPQEKIEFFINLAINYTTENVQHSRLLISLGLQIQEFPTLKDIVVSKYKFTIPYITELMRQAGHADPEGDATILASALDGIALTYLILGDEYPTESIRQTLMDRFAR
jgi:AcrR family transcriptional regulator